MLNKLTYTGIFTLTTLILLLLSGCGKNATTNNSNGPAPGTAYYIKFKLNGTLVTYAVNATGHISTSTTGSGTTTEFGIGAFETLSASSKKISILHQIPGSAFPTGTYALNPNSITNPFSVLYSLLATDPPQASYLNINTPVGAICNYTLFLNSISSTELAGTFTGNYLYNANTNDTVAITDGEFKVKRN
ncbi:MAG: hypothetical protein JNM14_04640 [Ferruginibacter sp.]|nr:hypothetical protein [Ferruginibacter sp.]